MNECEVCGGGGLYPILNLDGRHLYSITCPECYGVQLNTPKEPLVNETSPNEQQNEQAKTKPP